MKFIFDSHDTYDSNTLEDVFCELNEKEVEGDA